MRSPPPAALTFHAIRSGGPGGQNVNKVASAIQLRCDLKEWPQLPERIRARLRTLAGRRISDDDVIVITAQRHRNQEQNRRDALERLEAMIEQAAIEPKIRHATNPTRAAKERRLQGKVQRSRIKANRGKVRED